MTDQHQTTGGWWHRPVTVTRGEIVTAIVVWMLLDFITITVRHL